jgi:glyoxylase-like metal-dependent hydrolase (beta-lactamase superfamily II)
MREVAKGVFQLDGFPPDALNVYLVDDVLVDSGTRIDAGRILRQLRDRTVKAHVLTHAHPDHIGSSREVCEKLGIPFWVGAADVPAAEDPAVMEERLMRVPFTDMRVPRNPIISLIVGAQTGGGVPVDRALRTGDEVGGFEVIETPGHTEGHIALWREADGVLIAGDVLFNFRLLGGLPGLTEPFPFFGPDPARNRDSARLLAQFEPSVVCFGHGPPLRDTDRFVDFIAGLATD